MPSSAHSDKIVLITGASSGMGKETALQLGLKGVKGVTLFARRKGLLDEVAAEIKAMKCVTQVLVVVGDASNKQDNERAVKETVATFGGINSAFVNAGVFVGMKPLTETSNEDIDKIFNVNMKGIIFALRYILPAIAKTVGDSGPTGSVVVTSSCMGAVVISPKSAGASIYSASKAFVNSIVETAAIENAPRICVNAVLPGVVKTGIAPLDDKEYDAMAAQLQPLWGRAGTASEIASLVSYLIGNESSFISGSLIKADGLWGLSGMVALG